jgi:hypothetical protein
MSFMFRWMGSFLAILFLVCHAYAQAQDKAALEISIDKPASWSVYRGRNIEGDDATARLDAEQLRAHLSEKRMKLLMHVYKYEDVNVVPNPSLRIVIQPVGELKGKSAEVLMEHLIVTMKVDTVDFKVRTPIQSLKINGLDAAYVETRATTVRTADTKLRVVNNFTYLIPRGDYMVVAIGVIDAEDTNGLLQELRNVARTLKIR